MLYIYISEAHWLIVYTGWREQLS